MDFSLFSSRFVFLDGPRFDYLDAIPTGHEYLQGRSARTGEMRWPRPGDEDDDGSLPDDGNSGDGPFEPTDDEDERTIVKDDDEDEPEECAEDDGWGNFKDESSLSAGKAEAFNHHDDLDAASFQRRARFIQNAGQRSLERMNPGLYREAQSLIAKVQAELKSGKGEAHFEFMEWTLRNRDELGDTHFDYSRQAQEAFDRREGLDKIVGDISREDSVSDQRRILLDLHSIQKEIDRVNNALQHPTQKLSTWSPYARIVTVAADDPKNDRTVARADYGLLADRFRQHGYHESVPALRLAARFKILDELSKVQKLDPGEISRMSPEELTIQASGMRLARHFKPVEGESLVDYGRDVLERHDLNQRSPSERALSAPSNVGSSHNTFAAYQTNVRNAAKVMNASIPPSSELFSEEKSTVAKPAAAPVSSASSPAPQLSAIPHEPEEGPDFPEPEDRNPSRVSRFVSAIADGAKSLTSTASSVVKSTASTASSWLKKATGAAKTGWSKLFG